MNVILESKNLCRVCLENGADLSLFEEDDDMKLYLKIMACSTVQITEEDGYPNNICPVCYSMLDTAYKFKQKCETSDEKLRNCITTQELKIEIDYPEDDLSLPDMDNNSGDDYDPCDDITILKVEDINDVVMTPKRSKKRKIKWKSSKKKLINVVKKEKKRFKKFKSKCVTNNIASSLLEGKCSWDGREWRFDKVDMQEEEKERKELEELAKIKIEKDQIEKSKRSRRKVVKKEKPRCMNLCDTCGKVFKSKYHLTLHTRLKHEDHGPGDIKCLNADCKKTFKLAHYMQRHFKRCHTARKECICSECGKQYAFLSSLRQHMKTHTGNEVWKQCTFCPQKYRTQKSVDIHIRSVHTGERPSVCTMCDSAFFHPDYLKEHMRLHTGETPFKCPICKRGYAQRGNMKSHMKQHRMSELDETMKATMKPNYLKLLRDC